MTMHGIPASAYGSYGQGWQLPSSTQAPQQAGQTQQANSPMASILSQIQSSAQQLEAGGEDAEDAFTNAIQQISQQLNPSVAAKTSAATTATTTTTANGSSGTSTTSSTATNATAANSQTQTVHHRHHHFGGGGDDDSDDAQESQNDLLAGQASSSSATGTSVLGPLATAISQLIQNQSSNPSLTSFLNSQATSASTTSATGASATGTNSLVSQLSNQGSLTQAQAAQEIAAVLNSTSSTASASASGTSTSSSQLASLIQSLGSGSNASGMFGSWAQGMNQNLLSSMMSFSI